MKPNTKQAKRRNPVLGFVNIITEEYFTATYLGDEIIDGKTFYVLRPKTHPRIIKMSAESLKKVPMREAQ